MEGLGMRDFWRGKVVLLTGHTGFKGSWLSEILLNFGANVIGCALEARRENDLFHLCRLQDRLDHHIVDIRCKNKLMTIFQQTMPDIVFHLAAQPLVLPSYEDPVTTWDTNLMGSLNLLECLRGVGKRCSVVMVTTDKVYEISDENSAKIETDHLGGHDPYSSSKAATEIAVSSWRRSFLKQLDIRIATARAGNVIGGGDWSEHRIIPDLIKALQNETGLELRNPTAMRPWQHVLDPLFGYLQLAKALHLDHTEAYQESFNFGPNSELIATVNDLVNDASAVWDSKIELILKNVSQHETSYLSLDSTKAKDLLGWKPRWNFSETVFHTINWYKSYFQGNDAASLIKDQINAYADAV